MKPPKISVIVPVYNSEKWLRRCLDSILAQTFSDFEVLLIDDGSTDGSGSICDEYAERDSRVRVFHKSNGGVSSARNLGLDHAQGEWVVFIDSDDWVEPEYLETLMDNAKQADISICDFCLRGSDEKWIDAISDCYIERQSLPEFYESTFPMCYLTSPWAKIFKSKLIKEASARFDESLSSYEDTLFVINCLRRVNTIACSNKKLYNYWRGNVGLSSAECQDKNLNLAADKILRSLKALASAIGPINVNYIFERVIGLRIHQKILQAECSVRELVSVYASIDKLLVNNLLTWGGVGRKHKLVLMLIKNGFPVLAAILYKFINRL